MRIDLENVFISSGEGGQVIDASSGEVGQGRAGQGKYSRLRLCCLLHD